MSWSSTRAWCSGGSTSMSTPRFHKRLRLGSATWWQCRTLRERSAGQYSARVLREKQGDARCRGRSRVGGDCPLNLQLAPANSRFPSNSGSALLHSTLGRGPEWNYRLHPPTRSLGASGSQRVPIIGSIPRFKISRLPSPGCKNARNQLYVTSLSVSILVQKSFFFFLIIGFLA